MTIRATRTPKQSRSIKTVAAILEAATEVLADKGFEGLSTNAVATQAGINISTLYSYFPNKEALLERLLERYNDKTIEQLKPLLAGNPNKNERVGIILEAQAQLMVDEPWIKSLKEALANTPTLQSLQAHSSRHLIDVVITQIPQEIAGPKVSGDDQQVVMTLLVDTFNRGALIVANTPAASRKKMLTEVT
ncbi:TetR/AcrR family transcriptional regulator, partial [Halieaceae bacterium]|nr:TetR/AcrR family transcriptional regulator [Halieaceae bacterium]